MSDQEGERQPLLLGQSPTSQRHSAQPHDQSGTHPPAALYSNSFETESIPISIGTSIISNNSSNDDIYVQYCRRWYIIAVICMFSLSNGMLWISFAPIADRTATFYKISSMQVNWFVLVFPIVTIPVGFLAIWMLDAVGLRFSIIFGTWLNLIGMVIRFSSVYVSSHYSYVIALIGQILVGCAQPFALFTTTKVAAAWFKDNQRATANTIASMANPVGVLVASMFAPIVVVNHNDMWWLNLYFGIPVVLATLMATFGICSSHPPSPPSPSAAEMPESYKDSLKRLTSCGSFWILAFTLGCGLGVFTAISSLFQQILCVRGYSDKFAGLCGAMLIALGVVGATVTGILADRTRKFEEIAKIGFSCSALSCITFAVLANYPHFHAYILISIGLLGFFGFAMYPMGLELGVECTYPVPGATSTGLIMISGQIQTIIYTMAMEYISRPISYVDAVDQTCSDGQSGIEPRSYTGSLLLAAGATSFVALLMICAFKAPYKRLQTERQILAERIISTAQQRHI